MSSSSRDPAEKPDVETDGSGPERRVPGDGQAGYGEKGPPVKDDQAGLSEDEKLEEAVEDLSSDRN